jgi:hypothetical protein
MRLPNVGSVKADPAGPSDGGDGFWSTFRSDCALYVEGLDVCACTARTSRFITEIAQAATIANLTTASERQETDTRILPTVEQTVIDRGKRPR